MPKSYKRDQMRGGKAEKRWKKREKRLGNIIIVSDKEDFEICRPKP